MNTKLTLTIQQDIISRAKKYAKNKNRSLSDIIEHYLKAITEPDQIHEKPSANPVVGSLRGSFRMPENIEYKKELKKRRDKKYA